VGIVAEKYDYRSKVRKEMSREDVIPKAKTKTASNLKLPSAGRAPSRKSSSAMDMLEQFEKFAPKKEVTAKSGKFIKSAVKKPGTLRKIKK